MKNLLIISLLALTALLQPIQAHAGGQEQEVRAQIEQNMLGQALNTLENLEANGADEAWVFMLLGDIYTKMQDTDSAQVAYLKSIQVSPTKEAYTSLIALYKETGSTAKMRLMERKAKTEFPEITKKKKRNTLRVKKREATVEVKEQVSIKEDAYTLQERYLATKKTQDFLDAKRQLEALLTEDRHNIKAYTYLINLYLAKPKSWTQSTYKSRFNMAEDELYQVKRVYRRYQTYRKYNAKAYRYIENPLYEIDILVQRMHPGRRDSGSTYDKAWLANEYLKLAKAILSTNPNNPSEERDNAYSLLERGYDLDRTNTAIMTLRNSGRQRR